MSVRGNFEIEKVDFDQAVEKMKNEVTKNGIIIKQILCEPLNAGPSAIGNSIDFTADYIIEFLFLGEKDGEESIYNCYGYAFGMISEYVMNRPVAYPNPKATLCYGGIKNIEIEKVAGPVKEIVYNFYGWRKYEYEFIYQPVSEKLEFRYLKLAHPEYSVNCSRKIVKNFKIIKFILENDHFDVVKSLNSEPIRITNFGVKDAPSSDDIFRKIEDIIKENNKSVKKKKILTYID